VGYLCPTSRTRVSWERKWPLKPDIVLEGGKQCSNTRIYGGRSILIISNDTDAAAYGRRIVKMLAAGGRRVGDGKHCECEVTPEEPPHGNNRIFPSGLPHYTLDELELSRTATDTTSANLERSQSTP